MVAFRCIGRRAATATRDGLEQIVGRCFGSPTRATGLNCAKGTWAGEVETLAIFRVIHGRPRSYVRLLDKHNQGGPTWA
jgi:hypothetical protein